MAQPILHQKLQMNPLNLEPVLVLRSDLPLKLTPWNPVKNLDFHLDLLLLQLIISQQNPDSHLDLLPLLKLIPKNLKMKTNPRTKNHVSAVNSLPFSMLKSGNLKSTQNHKLGIL